METANKGKKSQPENSGSKPIANSLGENLETEQSEFPGVQRLIQKQHLTPNVIRHLQGTVGNQAVLRMLDKKQAKSKPTSSPTTFSSPLVQRLTGTRSVLDQDHTVDDPGIGDTVGSVGDYMGTSTQGPMGIQGQGTGDHWTGGGGSGAVGVTGGSLGTLSGMVGAGINVYNLKQNVESFSNANTVLDHLSGQYYGDGQEIPGNTELFATIELLKRQQTEAAKGILENTVGIYGSLNGFANGIATIVGATAGGAGATVAAAATFGFGSLLGAVIGTVSAIRDFVSVGKRMKSEKAIAKLKAGYVELYESLGSKLTAKKALNADRERRIKGLNKDVSDKRKELGAMTGDFADIKDTYFEKLQEIADAITGRVQLEKDLQADIPEVLNLGEKYDEYGQMVTALTTSERKQHAKGKALSGVLNLTGAAGGAALLALTLGAGAAAGPVGWVLSAVALVGILSYAAGMAIKRKIRSDNVDRMKHEIDLISLYVSDGAVSGKTPDDYEISDNPADRKEDLWYRDMFPTVVKKHFLSKAYTKLFGKGKSGKITIGERIAEIHEYLGKYDIGTQGEVAATGFIKALQPGSEGDQLVSNPAYSDKLTEDQKKDTPQQVTLRDLNMGLLAHYFGDGATEMKDSLLSDDEDMQNNAKKLLNKKLKLG